jgi:Flp pilus assembly protein TadG
VSGTVGERAESTGSLTGPSRSNPSTLRQAGQAAVEFALIVPFVAIMLLLVVQVGLVVRDQILVVHAAREGARQAAVDASPDAARNAALRSSTLDASRADVTISGRGGVGSRVRVEVRYGATQAPIVGVALGKLRLQASATMRVER